MKYIKSFESLVKVPVTSQISKKLMPAEISIETSNGSFVLTLTDYMVNLPKIYTAYHQSTPTETNDVLSDGEPDYLCIDLNFLKKENKLEINVELTYGDAMMYEFKIHRGGIDVFFYNGKDSKFDPDYKFNLTEKSIQDLLVFFNRLGFNHKRSDYNFLDSSRDSYDVTKNGGRTPTV